VTVGLAIGSPECGVPLCGREWITTLQPVVLCHWEASSAATSPALTTIGNWRGYGSVQFNGEVYGQKAHSFREFIDLPMKTRQPLVLAMAIHPGESADLEALRAHGWQLVDPGTVAGTPTLYRHFVAESKGEIGIAKSGYVKSRCGWFSDRSACYLAAGRPVIAQDTGFSKYLPTGRGLLPFTSELEAAQCIDRLNEDYDGHSQAARQLAEEFFASDKVLTRLLQHVGLAA
jgi:hypothetical protein